MFTQPQHQAITRLFNSYHADPIGHGRWGQKYVIGERAIQVVLPAELFDYSEAAAGVMGYGARPVGIRRTVSNAKEYIKEIFASEDNLAAFISTSDCSGPAFAERVLNERKAKNQKVIDPLASAEFWNRYTKQILAELVTKYGRSTVQEAYNGLTISEFEARFGLQKEVDTLAV